MTPFSTLSPTSSSSLELGCYSNLLDEVFLSVWRRSMMPPRSSLDTCQAYPAEKGGASKAIHLEKEEREPMAALRYPVLEESNEENGS